MLTKRALADLNKMCLYKSLKGEGRIEIMIMGMVLSFSGLTWLLTKETNNTIKV